MKLNKKSKIMISFALGTIMFTSTAIAQVTSKSGYDYLKDSAKYTVEQSINGLSSYTMDMSMIIKDNGKVISSENSISKIDVENMVREDVRTTIVDGGKHGNYFYSDKLGNTLKNTDDDTYYITEFQTPRVKETQSNPFKEKGIDDIEKIVDAVVGSLKDAVVVTENKDGSRILSGKLSEIQVPALINALVSYQCKQAFGTDYGQKEMPKIRKDVFVKEITGNMVTTKEGLIQSILGTGVLMGTEENGQEHTLTLEVLLKITNVNLTKINKPDLTGKKVEKNVEKDVEKDNNILSNPEKFIGKYKSDMLIERDGKLVKIGESFVDITTIGDRVASGRYYEEYRKGYEEYAANKKDYKFNASFEQDPSSGQFTSDSSSKDVIKGNLYLEPDSAELHFNMEVKSSNIILDSRYNRVFD